MKPITGILVCFFALIFSSVKSQVIFSDPTQNLEVDKNNIYYFEDKEDKLTIKEIYKNPDFKLIPGKSDVANFGITNSAFWFRLQVINKTDFGILILKLNQSTIDEVQFYTYDKSSQKFNLKIAGEYQYFFLRDYHTPEYLFDMLAPKDSLITFFIKIKCKENLQVPLVIGTRISIFNSSVMTNLASGIYIGIMIVMILYNLFVYTTVKDRSYLFYSAYIIFILLTQTSLQGYTFQFLWPNYPPLAVYSQFIFPVVVGLVGLEFFKEFLRVKERLNRMYKVSFLFFIPYTISLTLCFSGYYAVAFKIVEITSGFVAIYMLSIATVIYTRGFSEARFFLIGWSIFLVGICIFVMKDFEVFPYNNFTRYTMHFGSAIEVILLSFALADRINIFKREKEESQAEALAISLQNQELTAEQNIVLERKVLERTVDLEKANVEVNLAINKLKDAQIQLVDSEKMASLGQLTAGIAHEINNPINFVIANINPLRMDVVELLELIGKYESVTTEEVGAERFREIENFKKKIDLSYMKVEIEKILSGIDDGARRTAEIVSGLKNFSRLDESDVKSASINDGIESTLILLRSNIPKEIEVINNLSELPNIECYPGKLNQVFMNVLSNALYALNKQDSGKKKELKISSFEKDDKVIVVVEDTGIGMSKETKEKIYEPFFTTKDVGEGTGLGMSIVFKIIESHQAKIEIDSEVMKGTKVKIILNKRIVR